ncbi:hypothetical protein [Amycolatopsis rhizosphaerae]|nr:hypothetical protein [Amycolatopsis rhizosphaerae]
MNTQDVAAQVGDDSVWSHLEGGRVLLDPGAPPVLGQAASLLDRR